MKVRCVSCSEFSLKPRQANGSNEAIREIDRKFVALGAGRCSRTLLSNQWHPAEFERECDHHQAIAADQVAKRRALMQQRQEAVQGTLGT